MRPDIRRMAGKDYGTEAGARLGSNETGALKGDAPWTEVFAKDKEAVSDFLERSPVPIAQSIINISRKWYTGLQCLWASTHEYHRVKERIGPFVVSRVSSLSMAQTRAPRVPAASSSWAPRSSAILGR